MWALETLVFVWKHLAYSKFYFFISLMTRFLLPLSHILLFFNFTQVLTQLLGHDPSQSPDAPIHCPEPSITLAYLKHLWAAGFQHEAFRRLAHLMHELQTHDNAELKSKCCLKLGEWQQVNIFFC
jgi:hypothetical protein